MHAIPHSFCSICIVTFQRYPPSVNYNIDLETLENPAIKVDPSLFWRNPRTHGLLFLLPSQRDWHRLEVELALPFKLGPLNRAHPLLLNHMPRAVADVG